MFRFLESIQILNGSPQLLDLHQRRIEETAEKFVFKPPSIFEILKNKIFPKSGIFKGRFLYDEKVDYFEYESYTPPVFTEFFMLNANGYDYSSKFTERSFIHQAKSKLLPHQDLIFIQNGRLTDMSIGNLVFYNDEGLYTPKQPLLKGIQRSRYLTDGQISEREIYVEHLSEFTHFQWINALNEITPKRWLEISCIKPHRN